MPTILKYLALFLSLSFPTACLLTPYKKNYETKLISAIKKYNSINEENSEEKIETYLNEIKNALNDNNEEFRLTGPYIPDNLKQYILINDKKEFSALDYTLNISDFNVFLEVLLLLLPHIEKENLQEKLDKYVCMSFEKINLSEKNNILKLGLLTYLGANCTIEQTNHDDHLKLNKQNKKIIIGESKTIFKLANGNFDKLINSLNYFLEQQLITTILIKNHQKRELTSEQKQILELSKYRTQKFKIVGN